MESTHVTPLRGAELRAMRDACKIAAETRSYAGSLVAPGVTTDEIDAKVHEFVVARDCYPSPLGYSGFPKSICTSINDVVCHGIPDDRELQAGDVLNIDVSVYTRRGYHGDTAAMFRVGDVAPETEELLRVTEDVWRAAMQCCGPGVPMDRIGQVIGERIAHWNDEAGAAAAGKDETYSVVPEFTGHGIGRHFHMLPFVMSQPVGQSETMQEGWTFTVEPVVVQGAPQFVILDDGWTAKSSDGGWGAQYEHTLLITSNGFELLTEL